MVRNTNEGLASHGIENPNTIQYKEKNGKDNGKLPQTSLQVDDEENFRIEEDNAIWSGTHWAEEAISSYPQSTIFNLQLEAYQPSWGFTEKILHKT